jgi:hypothetical protein
MYGRKPRLTSCAVPIVQAVAFRPHTDSSGEIAACCELTPLQGLHNYFVQYMQVFLAKIDIGYLQVGIWSVCVGMSVGMCRYFELEL